MKILGIIPARRGSKGVAKKNSKLLKGKPLISYTIEAALNSKLVTDIIVSSDNEAILAIANSYKNIKVVKRPKELATDESPTISTVIHAIEFLKENGNEYDAICLLQPTNPFRTSSFIDEAILKFEETQKDCLVSVLEVPHQFNPHWVFEKKNNGNIEISTGDKEIITRRQELPKCYYRDGAIYLTKMSVLQNRKSFFGEKLGFIVSDSTFHVNIDSLDDWLKAEKMIIKLGI
ncbi:acylneuraminate cytidylyltransferase family protein [Lutibacter flavus]|uniref:N-acylneuraminate cytidylyltransferase n=1 Tax=Lutibacter flavus TaxID=691689 RepID=A0A238VQV1_9FLAO|nr:acylneuraminate cytidylyltransferase family protein [Lutibacter flavus]SNR36527.1 N-acylneuraminate cytidylyltransferase [Lutibacter flavus]